MVSAQMLEARAAIFYYTGKGVTSRRDVHVEARIGTPGQGIVFEVRNPKQNPDNESELIAIPARAEFVVNTLRNVTLGKDGVRLCIVEHFLAAAALWGIEDLSVIVDGPEMPLGDGSANFWIDLIERAGIERRTAQLAPIALKQPISIVKGDRSLTAIPDSKFSITYLMDWNHPKIGKCWRTWDASMPPQEISDARTFGSLQEHSMLGLTDDVVSLTPDGFTQPLRFDDEPVRHKLLDLVGDLALVGINPLRVQARFISIKGGHEMDVQLAKQLTAQIQTSV